MSLPNVPIWDKTERLQHRNRSLFVLALTRRNLSHDEVLISAFEEGLVFKGVIEDTSFDLFDNETDGLTDLWRDSVLVFERSYFSHEGMLKSYVDSVKAGA